MSRPSPRLFAGLALLLACAGCIVATAPPASAPPPPPPPPAAHPMSIEVGFFYDSLDPWGDWIWMAPHGWVWAPGTVDPFWRPYTVGRWAWTDHGYMWISDEPWGWAAYHYGRWTRAPRHGWVWVPGNVWGPAWVAWRHGPGVVGWAPLPPQVGFRAGVGVDFAGVNVDVVIRPDWWCFVDDVHIMEPRVHRHAYPVGRNVTVVRRTRHHGHIEHREGRVHNEGIGRERVERVVRRPLPRYRVVDDGLREGPAEVRGQEVRVWRPSVRDDARRPDPPRRAFGKPQADPPGHARQEDREPPPLPQAPPPVEKRIERNWERDWDRMLEMRRREARQKRQAVAAQEAPAPPEPSVERDRDENATAAENAYREQQAQRARAQREAEKPRPPARSPFGSKQAGKGKKKQAEPASQPQPPPEDEKRGQDKKDRH